MILLFDSAAHLLVDGVCAACLLGRLGQRPDLALLLILYNTLAFSTQGLAGLAADRFGGLKYLQSGAMMLTAAGFLLPLPPWAATCALGVGNSLFHVAGGAGTLIRSGGRARDLGIFVAPGAVGLTAGTLWPSLGGPLAGLLILLAVLRLLWREPAAAASPPVPEEKGRAAPVLLLTLSAAVRAVGGTAVSFPWNGTLLTALLLTGCVFAGKTAGGFLRDRIGSRPAALISLIPAALLIAFCSGWAAPALAGQFLLNLTMPVTLWMLYRLMPDRPGFAFGLAASALWPGTLAGQMMTLTGPALWACVILSFAFGLAAILLADKWILQREERV